MHVNEDGSAIIIDKTEYVLEGIPPEVWMNGPPSAFQDPRVMLPIVERIEQPSEGGFLCYYVGQKYPRKGIITPDALIATTIVKRLIKTTSILPFKLLKHFWSPRRMFWDFTNWYVENSHNVLERFYIKPVKGCKMVREFWKSAVESTKQLRLTDDERVTLNRVIMSVGLFFEFDDSYRYRAQDVLGEIDKDLFEKSPSDEINRLYKIMISRDGLEYGDGRGTPEGVPDPAALVRRMHKLILVLRIGLKISKTFRKVLKSFVSSLNVNEIKLDDADFYHCLVRYDYQYRGIPGRERMQMRKQVDEEYKKELELKRVQQSDGIPTSTSV